ncbi:hypothetical protein [Rathayibacter sp. Leaf296]|uniref:hypothetical protein n=1 Tax=Rathayibacter sp. Leaf296 TaxID=1736327 RepID=UPI000702C888|nr:hypothetical protein [Rathayibacter sp. Leaf296]KQQ08473.1 hypothetical protein ASF46_14315 [Rathayibacter sp. Leaf296]
MILLRTHSNRWIARARRAGTVVGVITLDTDPGRPVHRTVRLDPSGERVLLRDTESLEEAFAVLLAGIERARLALEAELAGPVAPVSVREILEDAATPPDEDGIAA